MTRITIDTGQVYKLANRFRSSINEIENIIRRLDDDLGNLNWEGNLRGPIMREWKKEKSALVQLTNKTNSIYYNLHRRAELFEPVDRECRASLNKIHSATEELFFSLLTSRKDIDRLIALTRDRLDEAKVELRRVAQEADQALEIERSAWKKLQKTEAMRDVIEAEQVLSDCGIEDGPWKSFLVWARVTGDDMADFLGITALFEYLESYESGSGISTESTIHATLTAIRHEAGLVFGAGWEAGELSTGITQANFSRFRELQSNQAMKSFFEAQNVVDEIQKEMDTLHKQRKMLPSLFKK